MRMNSGIPTRKISAGSDTYKRGFHKGDSGGLDAVDTDLATANIKNGIIMFGKAGSTNVRDSSDADAALADVKNGKTFYAGGGAKKTGNLATRTLDPANETVQAGYYAATTLSAVDGDLAVGNIKSGVTIFGKLGTLLVAYDDEGTDVCDDGTYSTGRWYQERKDPLGAGADWTFFTTTIACAQATVLFGFGAGSGVSFTQAAKVRLYIDGVQIAESANLHTEYIKSWCLGGHRSVSSGDRIVRIDGHNYGGANTIFIISGGVGGGCAKI